MLYIFDKNDKLLKILTEYKNFEYIEKLNNENEISFDSNEIEYLIKDNKAGFFNKNDEFKLFLIDDVKEFKDEYSTTITLNCINDLYVLNNKIIEDRRIINGSVSSALEKALEGTEYKPGKIEEFENKDINFYFISSMKALNNIIDTYDCEFTTRIEINRNTGEISNKYIDIKHRIGCETGLRFTYDTNLTSIEKTPVSDVFNVLYGQGKSLETQNGGYSRKLDFSSVNNGLKYIEDIESIKKYGRKEGIFENNNIDDPNTLLVKTREKLNEVKNRKYSYEVNVEDLSNFKDFEHYKYSIGDSIIIMDEEDNVSLTARIIAINTTEDTTTLTLGYFQNGLFDEDIEDSITDLKDKVNNILNNNDNNIDDNKYPDTLPVVPVVEAKGLFSTIVLSWTYENKSYYTYEVFASKIKDFNPSTANRIFEGKASSFLHEVKPDETWYYRVRAKNTHDKFTSYSAQVVATTRKIADGTEYFEELAISHALIASLDLDKAVVGKLKAQFLDVYNLLVRDGNGKKTLEIDSFGNVNLDVTNLKVKSKDVEKSFEETNETFKAINLIKNSTAAINLDYWDGENGNIQRITSSTIKEHVGKVHYFNLSREGDFQLIQDGDTNIVIDCGYDNTTTEVINYLKAQNVTKIDLFISTHFHADHMGGFSLLADTFYIKEALYKKLDTIKIDKIEPESEGYKTKKLYNDFLEKCREKCINYREFKNLESIRLSDYSSLRIHNVKCDDYSSYNNVSIAVLYNCFGKKVLLSGDMTHTSEQYTAGEYGKIDVLKAGHHCYDRSVSERFLNEVNPIVVVATTPYVGSTSKKKCIGTIQWKGKKLYDTGTNGTMITTITSTTIGTTGLKTNFLLTNTWWHRRTVGDFEEWVWFQSDGSIAKNKSLTINNKLYHFNAAGICRNPKGEVI